MAKVTLIIEDGETLDGHPTIKASIKSDNEDPLDVTPAEIFAAEIFDTIKTVSKLSPDAFVNTTPKGGGNKPTH